MRASIGRSLVAGLFPLLVFACASALPTPQEEQRVDDYDKALRRCKDDAMARDADITDYRACAAKVDRDFGRGDAGGA